MNAAPAQLTLEAWDARYAALRAQGLVEPPYGGPLARHVTEGGDLRLRHLRFDNSAAALRLWNFLLTEEDRLAAARAAGHKLVGAMKDLGTVPVMAYALPGVTAFYPDGAWWIPCIMELSTGLLRIADGLGIDESFCPVRAMLGAFVDGGHFPIPELLVCSVGATCTDFSAIAQRLQGLGHPILWWEIPPRREPDPGEDAVPLPGGARAPRAQVALVRGELARVRAALEVLAGRRLTDDALRDGIVAANAVRRCLDRLRTAVFTAPSCPLPALELLIAEMLAIHFCSDRAECLAVLQDLADEVDRRVTRGLAVLPADAIRVFWVNPVADLRAMNLLEECGGRLCGTDFMFAHALDPIPADGDPLDALAAAALADPMAGSAGERAARIVADARRYGAEAVIVARVPGASHCALEGGAIHDAVRASPGLPCIELEVPPLIDAMLPTLRTRIAALVETARYQRRTPPC